MPKLNLLVLLIISLPIMNCGATNPRVGGITAQAAFADPKVAQMVEAASDGDFKEVDAQIQAGADVNAIGKERETPLIWQVYLRNVKATEKLLQVGANPNYRDSENHLSALYLAVDAGRADLLEILLRYHGDPNIVSRNGESLLQASIMCPPCVDLLIKYHVDLNYQYYSKHGEGSGVNVTAADTAVALGQYDVLVTLLEHGFNKDLQDLALSIQGRDVPPDSDAQQFKNKAIEMLKARGVTYPDPRYSPPKPPPGWQ